MSNSKSGIDFSARNVDINFASLDTLENTKDYTTTIKDKARTEYGRPLSTMTYGLVVVRDTEKEAKEVFQQVVDMQSDYGAAENVINIALSGSAGSFEHARSSRSASSPAGAATRWWARRSRSSKGCSSSTRLAWTG